MRASVHGRVPAPVIAALERLGLELGEGGDVAFVWYDPSAGGVDLEDLGALARFGEPVVAFVSRPEYKETALAAGATLALGALPGPSELRAQLAALARATATWRGAVRNQQLRARRAQQEHARDRSLLQGILDLNPNPIMVADLRGRVLRFNSAAEIALGYTADEALNHMHVTDFYADPGDARRVMAEIRVSGEGGTALRDIRLRARSGEHVPATLRVGEILDSNGVLVGTYGIIQDLREQLSLKHRLAAATEQLIATEKRAAAVAVAGAAAHELNQPLTAVMGTIEILELHPGIPPDVRDRLGRTYGQLERMAAIVRTLAQATQRPTIEYVAGDQIVDLSDPSVD